jgi:hypothetical protein
VEKENIHLLKNYIDFCSHELVQAKMYHARTYNLVETIAKNLSISRELKSGLAAKLMSPFDWTFHKSLVETLLAELD